jgi:tetratricopeptide (TPR) repeat protein
VATSLGNLAVLYQAQGRYAEAESVYKRVLTIVEKVIGPRHPIVAIVCENMAELCRQVGREDEAEKLEARARKIRFNQ